MKTMTEFDLHLTDHLTRIARVNEQRWMWEASPPTGVPPVSRTTIALASTRRRLGESVVRLGEWLRGAPTAHVADRAAA